MLEILFFVDKESKTSIYYQLYNHIKNEITSKRLKYGVKLPSIRKMAEHLLLSKNTIESAYNQLLVEGYIISKAGSGYFVEKIGETHYTEVSNVSFEKINSIHLDSRHYKYNFKPGSVDFKTFPFSKWRQLSNEVMSGSYDDILTYGDPRGEEALRKEIANYIRFSRGVICSHDQIIIGAGTQQLMTTLCIIQNKMDKSIAFEEPGFTASRHVFESFGYHIIPISLDRTGINTEELFKHSPSLVYTTPSNQHPYGLIMPINKRISLLNWASQNNTYIIEDDYDSEYRYQCNPIPSLQGLDKNNCVIYLGTFSKSLLPSIHMSYMVLPKQLTKQFNDKALAFNQTASKVHQKTLELFMNRGYFERHLRKMRKLYNIKHQHLVSALSYAFKENITLHGINSGLIMLVEVHNNMCEDELILSAKALDVKVYPSSWYWYNKEKSATNTVMLGFGNISIDDITSAVALLKKAWL